MIREGLTVFTLFFVIGCGMQRTGGEESIPVVEFTGEDSVIYCEARTLKPLRCKPDTTYECLVADASKRYRSGDRFNPLENCDE